MSEASVDPTRDRPRLEERLPAFSIQRRITVVVLLLTVLVVGLVAAVGTPLELLPRGFEMPMLTVQAFWNDAPAQEMLDKVALPLEEEISTVPGIENLSTFAGTSFTRLRVTFEQSADMDVAYREMRDRIERAKTRLPEEVDRVLIRKADDSQIPVFAFGITTDADLADPYNLIDTGIVRRIERLDGVAGVDVQGLVEKEVLIELDRRATEAAGLDIFRLGQELASDNFSMASGHVESAGKKLLLRSIARYADLEALRQRQLAPGVRLGDVATVRYSEPERRFFARANSQPAYFAIVFKESEANALEVSERISAAVETMEADPRLALVGIDVFFNQGQTILESLGVLLDSGRIGALMAGLVLFFFLRRARLTLIVALSIPVSILIALVVLYFGGETLNILSLLGLMISVGLLVDNSVVVAENIFRLHQEGHDRRTATLRGTGEISLAIVTATLTTVVVFLPVSLVDGQARFFLLRLSIPITASLIGSLLVALVFVPLAVHTTLPSRAAAPAEGSFRRRSQVALRRAYEASIGRLNRFYVRVLARSLRRRADLVLTVLVILGLTAAIPGRLVETGLVQEEERGGFEVDIDLPGTSTLEDSSAYFAEIEKILEQKKDEWDLRTYLIIHWARGGEVQGWFDVPRSNDLTPRELTEQLIELIPERGGVKIYTGASEEDSEDEAIQTFTLIGDDAAELDALASDIEDLMAEDPGVLGIRRAEADPEAEMGLSIDRERAQELGIAPSTIAGVVRNALGGRPLPEFYRDGREIPVRIRYREEDRESLGQLFDFRVPAIAEDGTFGETVSLGTLTTAERLSTTGRIFRTNKQVSRTISLELVEGEEAATRERLRAQSARIDLPEGVRFGQPRRGGEAEEMRTMLFAMLLSVVFIYLLMGFLFESFILPLSILTTIPLAIVGVYWGHLVFGVTMDLLGIVGIVLLIGVVVNNGIVLVDAINRLREEGERRHRAILLAAERRFRPILMTALTTISGMIPLLFGGQTSIGLSYESFGVTLIGGMAVATLLTLLVVPITYTFFDDLRSRLERTLADALAQPTAPSKTRRPAPPLARQGMSKGEGRF